MRGKRRKENGYAKRKGVNEQGCGGLLLEYRELTSKEGKEHAGDGKEGLTHYEICYKIANLSY